MPRAEATTINRIWGWDISQKSKGNKKNKQVMLQRYIVCTGPPSAYSRIVPEEEIIYPHKIPGE